MTEIAIADKGGIMEEVLRQYFLDQGYYVVRGARYVFTGIEITDVDLWLYQRTSSFSRQRFNVDIKNKRTPQALERILWARGIKESLRLDGVLVATTDSRALLRDFGERNGVTILDGILLSKLKKRYSGCSQRLFEEEFLSLISGEAKDRLSTDWIDRLDHAKSRVLTQLDFDGCNALIDHLFYFAEQMQTAPVRAITACRCFYLILSLTMITLDFIARDFALIERSLQVERLNDGFRFGTMGRAGAEKMLAMASSMVAASKSRQTKQREVLKELKDQSMQLPVDILTEFILKINHGKNLFEVALGFERFAYSRTFSAPNSIHPDYRSVIGVLLDFHQIDRKEFFSILSTDPQVPSVDELRRPLSDQPELS